MTRYSIFDPQPPVNNAQLVIILCCVLGAWGLAGNSDFEQEVLAAKTQCESRKGWQWDDKTLNCKAIKEPRHAAP